MTWLRLGPFALRLLFRFLPAYFFIGVKFERGCLELPNGQEYPLRVVRACLLPAFVLELQCFQAEELWEKLSQSE